MILALATIAGCHNSDPAAQSTDSAGDSTTSTSGAPTDTGDPPVSTSSTTTATTTGESPTTGDPAGTTTGEPDTTGDPDTAGTTGTPVEPWQPKGCPEIYAQDLFPTFEIEISNGELNDLEDEWQAADDNNTPEHPLEKFIYEDTVITDASARLRGNATWWPGQGKMQLEVSFNTYDDKGRFMGLKHLLFDAAEFNRSFLRDRLAMHILRDVGVPAPCANNARLVINGEYYGLFTNIEKVDSEFIERYWEDDSGNLYKQGVPWEKKTNESDPSMDDLEALYDANTIAELESMLNLEEAILEWATEAVMPDNDGAWAGGLNSYMYNDPASGFHVIPWDKDATFDRIEPDVDPVTFMKENPHGRPLYDLALSDPKWFGKYIETIEFVLDHGYDVGVLQGRIDAWTAQIQDAAESDPNKPFSNKQYHNGVDVHREFIAERAAFLKHWLECWQNGGVDQNHDGHCDG
jgi:hypothetical protein